MFRLALCAQRSGRLLARAGLLLSACCALAASGCEEEPWPAADAAPDAAPDDTADASSAHADSGTQTSADAAPGDANSGASMDASTAPADSGSDASASDASDHAVGTLRVELAIGSGRVLPLQLWYPAVESAREAARQGRPLQELEPPGPRRDALEKLLEGDSKSCASHSFHAAEGAAPLPSAQPYPLLVFSHCMDCVRYSVLSIAEQLAAAGFVVAAPDHQNGTLYDELDDDSVGLDPDFLDQRVTDLTRVLDLLLDASTAVVPEGLRGRLDAARVGVFGHSEGSATAGLVAQQDPRPKALALLAAPIGLPGVPVLDELVVDISSMTKPALFVLASEDNAITELGNEVIREDFAQYPVESWLLTLRDAGHYSFTDICGLIPLYEPGCGEGERQTTLLDESFSYLDIGVARDATKRAITAFFQKTLLEIGAGPEGLVLPAEATLEHQPGTH